MAASHHDRADLEGPETEETEEVTRLADPPTRALARFGSLREWLSDKDRPFLLFTGLAISLIGAITLTTTVANLSRGRTGQPVPIPDTARPESSASQEVAGGTEPEAPKESTRRPSSEGPGVGRDRATKLIQNGTFSGSIAPWQGNPAAQFSLGRNQLQIDVAPDADGKAGAAQIASNSFSLIPAQTYTLKFNAGASAPTTIVAIVRSERQPEGRPPITMLTQSSGLGPTPQSFVFGFTAPVDTVPSATLRFRFTSDTRTAATLDHVAINPA